MYRHRSCTPRFPALAGLTPDPRIKTPGQTPCGPAFYTGIVDDAGIGEKSAAFWRHAVVCAERDRDPGGESVGANIRMRQAVSFGHARLTISGYHVPTQRQCPQSSRLVAGREPRQQHRGQTGGSAGARRGCNLRPNGVDMRGRRPSTGYTLREDGTGGSRTHKNAVNKSDPAIPQTKTPTPPGRRTYMNKRKVSSPQNAMQCRL